MITDIELRVAGETIYLTYIFEISVISIALHLNNTNTAIRFAVKNIKTTKNFKSFLYLLKECRRKIKKLKGSESIYFSRLKMPQLSKIEPGSFCNKLEIIFIALI